MKTPLFQKSRTRHREHGITILLVALAMIAIVGMAALSIDVITLYLAKEEAQRTADSAALAGAKILSLSGITGDPDNNSLNWSSICGGSTSAATLAAQAVAQQNAVSGIVPTSVSVTYSGGSGGSITSTSDCTTLTLTAFGVNPMVTVQLTRNNLPSFFSRIWGNPGINISATATAEAFNPSNSGNVGNQTTGSLIPVQPRCVKPWIVPNLDPGTGSCSGNPSTCPPLVSTADGSIQNPGISLNGGIPNTGVIGETFWLIPDCQNNPTKCMVVAPPQANYPTGGFVFAPPPNLFYVPNQDTTIPVAVSSCNNANPFNKAIVGCDQPTNYQCGVKDVNVADLSIGPVSDTIAGVSCLIHQADTTNVTASTGQDYFATFAAPSIYPFQILAGSGNPVVGAGLASGSQITVSPSIVSLPIYDYSEPVTFTTGNPTNVTFVGFLQVFINAVDVNGDVKVTVLNVAGCSNNATAASVSGNSPVPVRLITPP